MTISSEAELERTQGRIAELERGMVSARQRLSTNPTALAHLLSLQDRQIEQLHAEVREFIGIGGQPTAAIELSYDTKDGTSGTTSLSTLATVSDNLRSALTNIAETIIKGTARASGRPEARVARAVDLRVTGISSGSFVLQLEYPIPQDADAAVTTEDLADLALSIVEDAARWIESGATEPPPSLVTGVLRDVALAELRRLAPSEGSTIHWIQLRRTALAVPPIRLTRDTSRRVNALVEKSLKTETVSITGLLREIDLDKQSFELRDPQETLHKCSIDVPLLIEAARYVAAQQTVRVRGSRTGRVLHVSVIEPLTVLDGDNTAERPPVSD